ncbi:MAG: hypothetical protein ACR2L6_10770 [Gemmatimonadaceae bacterium]
MSSGLILVLLVASAFVAAHFAFERLGKRFLIVSGAEYLALGILLGPQVSGIFTPALLDSLAAFPALALGWMGAIIGMRFYLPELIKIPGATYRVASGPPASASAARSARAGRSSRTPSGATCGPGSWHRRASLSASPPWSPRFTRFGEPHSAHFSWR